MIRSYEQNAGGKITSANNLKVHSFCTAMGWFLKQIISKTYEIQMPLVMQTIISYLLSLLGQKQ
jgi:hypothetical protein